MFGDFGPSSPRNRISRERSPFDSLRSHHPMFPERDWEESHMQRAANTPKGSTRSSSSSRNGHPVERIIPIQIVGSPSPPPPETMSTAKEPEPPKPETIIGPSAPPIVLGWPAESTAAPDTTDKKYPTQRHNTTDNIHLKTLSEETNQRAKSEPPNTKFVRPESTEPLPSAAVPSPSSAHVTELGGNKSKDRGNGATATGCRSIPIVVEGSSGSGGFFKKGTNVPQPQQPQSSPKIRPLQTDYPESTTPTPPPFKKLTKDTMQIITEIVEEVKSLEEQVNVLPFTPKTSKTYIYLDEMLTRNLIKLDTIETEGKEDIRIARRDCIKLIQKVIGTLEEKSQETVVPYNPANPDDVTGSPLVPIQLALTPTTNVTPPVLVTAETMEIDNDNDSSTINVAVGNKEEPQVINPTVTAQVPK